MSIYRTRPIGHQRGAVLLVSLILLVLITLFVLAAMNFTNVQTRIAGNLQVRNEMKAAAQQAIEDVISANFTLNPADAIRFFDVNGDGVDDYKITVSHTCVSSVTIPIDDLDGRVRQGASPADGSGGRGDHDDAHASERHDPADLRDGVASYVDFGEPAG